MDIKEAVKTLKEYCSRIDDCTECLLYLQDEHYEMYCHVTDRAPEDYDINRIE